MDLAKFMISETEYIKIIPEHIGKDDCEVCAHCDIDYIDEEKNIIIRFGYEFTSTFCYKIAEYGNIQKLINGKMKIDTKVSNDLGFDWNQYFEGIIKDTDVETYHCWSNSHKQIRPYYSSWMYNDKNGNIVFEITPFYPWHGETKKSNPNFITYKKFMKDYKPRVKAIIQKENLIKWIDQAKELKRKFIDVHKTK
ncbi:MAG: hypothetical protein NTU89_00185 [Candidatus Dependentiae bacterium]|nr:hypothetical protein [Candidatus Dependentiae bacterium]